VNEPGDGWTGLHATALIVGERGLLLRGPAGSGKSGLALALIAGAREMATFAALIGDDRVFLRVQAGRLLARGAPGFAGMIERRGEGIVTVRHAESAVVRLVVDLAERGATIARIPGDGEAFVEVLGVRVARVRLDPGHGPLDHAYAAMERLARLS
jgi:HPr kinase/phosphorylase